MRERTTSSRALLTGLAAIGVALLGASPAVAAPTWLEHVDLSAVDPGTGDGTDSATQNASAPRVAVDPQGDATAIWARSDGVGTVIQTTSRPAGGAWLPTSDLSGAGTADIPQLGVDAQGGAVAIWSQSDGVNVVVQAAVRPAGGGWQPTADTLSAAIGSAFAPRLAVDARGDAVAVWTRYDDPSGHQVVQAAERPAGGSWGAPADLSTNDADASKPQVALDGQGDAVVVWASSDGTNQIIRAAEKPGDAGVWSLPAVDLTTTGVATTPQVAATSGGAVVAVWSALAGAHYVVQAADGTTAGAWQPPVSLSDPASDALDGQLALDPQGGGTVVWQRPSGGTVYVESAARRGGGAWQPAIPLSGGGVDSTDPQVAVNAAGAAVAVWARARSTGTVVQAAASPTPGAWGAGEDLTGDGAPAISPQVAIDAQGNAVALWTRAEAFGQVAQTKCYDAAGPLLPGLSIPSTGVAGQVASFAVSPLDTWSAVAQTTWSFGDGTGADGTAVDHVYAAPGTYAVTVTSTDVLALASSAAGTVTIDPAPAQPGPPAQPGQPAAPPPIAPVTARPPVISKVSLTHRRFRTTRKLSAAARRARPKAHAGTSFRFTLSASSKLTITITRGAAGLRRGHACVAPTASLRRRHAKRCTRTLTVGTLTHRVTRAGAGSFAFGGRIGRRWLAPGAYRARLVASNAGGRSRVVAVTFTVVR